MKWWKRLIFSVISLFFGFISLDFLYMAFGMMTGSGRYQVVNQTQKQVLIQLLGAVFFLIWLLILAGYTALIKNAGQSIDWVEEDTRTGERKVRKKWFDMVLQYALMITGVALRWMYLFLIYFPGQ